MPTQRLSLTQNVTASGSGTATFTFPAPPTDLVWIGTLVCNQAPAGAAFTATVAGTQWGTWNGTATGGPVQCLPGEQLVVVATGLTNLSAFALQWTGRSDSLSESQPSWPDTNASPGGVATQSAGTPSTVVSLIGGALRVTATTASATTVSLLGPPSAGTEYLLRHAAFTLGSGTTQVQIVGHSTGFVYTQAFSSAEVLDNLAGQIVPEALDFTTIGGGGSIWLTYDNGVPPVPSGTGTATPPTISAVPAASVHNTHSGFRTVTSSMVTPNIGDLVVVSAASFQTATGPGTLTITDSLGGAWTTQVATFVENTLTAVAMFFRIATAADHASGFTVTITDSGAGGTPRCEVEVDLFRFSSGFFTGGDLSAHGGNLASVTTFSFSPSAGSSQPLNINELAVVAFYNQNGGPGPTGTNTATGTSAPINLAPIISPAIVNGQAGGLFVQFCTGFEGSLTPGTNVFTVTYSPTASSMVGMAATFYQ